MDHSTSPHEDAAVGVHPRSSGFDLNHLGSYYQSPTRVNRFFL